MQQRVEDFVGAKATLLRVQGIFDSALGDAAADHPDYAMYKLAVAAACLDLGQAQEAEPIVAWAMEQLEGRGEGSQTFMLEVSCRLLGVRAGLEVRAWVWCVVVGVSEGFSSLHARLCVCVCGGLGLSPHLSAWLVLAAYVVSELRMALICVRASWGRGSWAGRQRSRRFYRS
jgi:hypothetical protein